MPYSNPEDKRRWEREHRQERNESRRRRRLSTRIPVTMQTVAPEPIVFADTDNAGYAVALAIVVLSVGLLLVAFAVWKFRVKKHASEPVPDPQTLGGGSND
jgi:hypothetical protein